MAASGLSLRSACSAQRSPPLLESSLNAPILCVRFDGLCQSLIEGARRGCLLFYSFASVSCCSSTRRRGMERSQTRNKAGKPHPSILNRARPLVTLSSRSSDGGARKMHRMAVTPLGAPRILVPPSSGMTHKIRGAPPKAITMQTQGASLVVTSATSVSRRGRAHDLLPHAAECRLHRRRRAKDLKERIRGPSRSQLGNTSMRSYRKRRQSPSRPLRRTQMSTI